MAGASHPGTALPATHRPRPGTRQDGTATHRTPSLRLKSSWSGSPLRWKTAITPLWMLQAEKGMLCPEAPRAPPPPLLPYFCPSALLLCGRNRCAWSEAEHLSFLLEGRPWRAGTDCPRETLSTPQLFPRSWAPSLLLTSQDVLCTPHTLCFPSCAPESSTPRTKTRATLIAFHPQHIHVRLAFSPWASRCPLPAPAHPASTSTAGLGSVPAPTGRLQAATMLHSDPFCCLLLPLCHLRT